MGPIQLLVTLAAGGVNVCAVGRNYVIAAICRWVENGLMFSHES